MTAPTPGYITADIDLLSLRENSPTIAIEYTPTVLLQLRLSSTPQPLTNSSPEQLSATFADGATQIPVSQLPRNVVIDLSEVDISLAFQPIPGAEKTSLPPSQPGTVPCSQSKLAPELRRTLYLRGDVSSDFVNYDDGHLYGQSPFLLTQHSA